MYSSVSFIHRQQSGGTMRAQTHCTVCRTINASPWNPCCKTNKTNIVETEWTRDGKCAGCGSERDVDKKKKEQNCTEGNLNIYNANWHIVRGIGIDIRSNLCSDSPCDDFLHALSFQIYCDGACNKTIVIVYLVPYSSTDGQFLYMNRFSDDSPTILSPLASRCTNIERSTRLPKGPIAALFYRFAVQCTCVTVNMHLREYDLSTLPMAHLLLYDEHFSTCFSCHLCMCENIFFFLRSTLIKCTADDDHRCYACVSVRRHRNT